MNVHQKLMKSRIDFLSKEIKKSGMNKFAGYSYFELPDFIPIAMQIFWDNGLCSVINFNSDYATLTLTDMDDQEQQIIFTSPMASANLKGCHDVQNLGASETYIRRYLYVIALEIVEHDVLDSTHGKEEIEKQQNTGKLAPVKLTAQQVRDQQGWIAVGLSEINQGRTAADWWKEFGEKVKEDCTIEGAKEVYNKVVKK